MKIKVLKESSRSQIIDQIEDVYSGPNWEMVEDTFKEVTGKDVNTVDDNDPSEGFYAHYTTDELQKVLDALEQSVSGPLGITGLNQKQYSFLERALEMFADPSFTKDREESEIAKQILRKMR